MKSVCKSLSLLSLILLNGMVWIAACESDLITGDDDDQDNDPKLPAVFDPDQALELFSFEGAWKVSGNLPAAPAGQLKISVKDTIFMPIGFPVGERLVVRHNGLYDISGFFIAVENSSFYYDVSVVEAEAQDSTDVIYLSLDETEGFDWEGFPLILLPHKDGIPLDEFIRQVEIEKPGEDAESITVPTSFSLDLVHWEWKVTLQEDPANPRGRGINVTAKGLKKISTYQTGGCCNDDGTSTTVANDPYCFSKYSDGTPNLVWRSIDVSHFFMWAYDILYLYDDGTFRQASLSTQTNYRPSLSDFCNNDPTYDFDISKFVNTGTHDFTPGATSINFTYNPTDPPVYGKNIYGGEIIYSSHNMAISFGSEGAKWWFYYKRPSNGVPLNTQLSLEGWD
ncbi:hypothetical protein WJR50_23670 [Catalinimonas sp. 4WD22]|uniref:hypothetical protein n=1 Tax=Catalinimonas locisalis TaxID=3133978 RepID=UPI0031011939